MIRVYGPRDTIRTTSEPGDIDGVWLHLDGHVICPDLLRLEMLGAADNLRGRIVRLFFRLLDRVMPVAGE